jgi:hypothetical protein
MSPPLAKKASARQKKDGSSRDGDDGGAEAGSHGRIDGEVPIIVQAGRPHDVAVVAPDNVDVGMDVVMGVGMDAGAHAHAKQQNPADIYLVMVQTGKSWEEAAAALDRNNGDIVDAIMELAFRT